MCTHVTDGLRRGLLLPLDRLRVPCALSALGFACSVFANICEQGTVGAAFLQALIWIFALLFSVTFRRVGIQRADLKTKLRNQTTLTAHQSTSCAALASCRRYESIKSSSSPSSTACTCGAAKVEECVYCAPRSPHRARCEHSYGATTCRPRSARRACDVSQPVRASLTILYGACQAYDGQ